MKDPLSIAFLSHVASQQAPTGAERSLALLAAGMRRRGHRVLVVVPGPWSLAAELRGAGVELLCEPARACWLSYHDPRPWPEAWVRWLRWAWPQAAVRRIARRLGEWQAEVVHVNCLPHLRGAAAGRRAGLPVVWHLREILPPGPRRRWLAARLARDADALLAVSEAVARWLAEEGLAGRSRVVHNGVAPTRAVEQPPAARRALGLPEEGVYFGLFGQLTRHKGALSFVEAGRRVLEREPQARFVLAGPGPPGFRSEVQQALAATERSARFHLLPAQPGSERLLAAADVVCLATLTPDPFPRAVLEAMAAGKPVVAFDSGGTSEMLRDGETGLLVRAGDVDGLARAFLRLAADPSSRETMGRAGRQRARAEFSVDRHLDAVEAVLRSVVR
jgi:glycosyltransferase involved in cell wall biosynthesis